MCRQLPVTLSHCEDLHSSVRFPPNEHKASFLGFFPLNSFKASIKGGKNFLVFSLYITVIHRRWFSNKNAGDKEIFYIIYRKRFGSKCQCSNINGCFFGHLQVTTPVQFSVCRQCQKSGGALSSPLLQRKICFCNLILGLPKWRDHCERSEVRTESTILTLSSCTTSLDTGSIFWQLVSIQLQMTPSQVTSSKTTGAHRGAS